jgi:hypothetical protein
LARRVPYVSEPLPATALGLPLADRVGVQELGEHHGTPRTGGLGFLERQPSDALEAPADVGDGEVFVEVPPPKAQDLPRRIPVARAMAMGNSRRLDPRAASRIWVARAGSI